LNIKSSPEWTLRTKIIVGLISFAFIVTLLWFIRGVFPIVVVSLLIAFVLNPLVTFLTRRVFIARQNRGPRRGLAALISFLIAFFVIFSLFLIIIPTLLDEVAEFGRGIPSFVETFASQIEVFLEQPITFGEDSFMIDGEPFIPLDRIEEVTGTRDLTQMLQLDEVDLAAAAETFLGSARNLSGPAFSFLGSAFSTIINVIFLIMITFYLLKDGDRFIEITVHLIPEDHQEDALHLLHRLSDVWGAYLRGQLILSLVMGFAVYFASLLLGLPNALILGVLAGLLEFIPNLGPLIALIPAAFLALVSQSTTVDYLVGFPFMVVVIVVWTILQNIEAVFLVPRIMGDSLHLHPIVVIIAVLGGAALAGALGVILAAPFVASGRVIAQYIYGKISNTEPFPVIDEERVKEPPTILAKLVKSFWHVCSSTVGSLYGRHRGKSAQVSDTD
jgi:predicted PurR-regulated permease PerM